ncbi:hypothetical protein [Gemmobacter caeruleus]|uniref:hypothetical protein n=1 Tax=Gemmobacter caeruleus TaxID=2595004 RepID=UPI0011ECCF52|nr:hypothetical protein [Gemmobacter caeruleus]
MALRTEHEIHQRRLGRNLGLGLVLAAFVVLVFGLTVVKVTRGDPMQAFDHSARPEMVPADAAQGAGQ